MNSYQADLSDIKSELEAYYAADFDSEQVNTAETTRIKMQLDNLINNASKELSTKDFLQLKNEVLGLFLEIPECVGDDVLFLSLISSLLRNGVLSKEETSNVLYASSRRRCGST